MGDERFVRYTGTIPEQISLVSAEEQASLLNDPAMPTIVPKAKRADTGSRAKILVVDDSEMVRRGLRQLLTRGDRWEVCGEASDGEEAIEKACNLSPDVVVLDFSMPLMNGIETARRIRAKRPHTALVLCSMYFDHQLASMAREVGITSVLSKSNVGQVIKGVEAGLRGEPFIQAQL